MKKNSSGLELFSPLFVSLWVGPVCLEVIQIRTVVVGIIFLGPGACPAVGIPNGPNGAARLIRWLADILSKLGPPVEMLFTSSLPVHILAIYHNDLTLQQQQHMHVQEIGSYYLQEQEGLEQQEE